MTAAVESLPLGVGRVPKWWMEITPHYLLDVEEDQQNRLREAQLSYYFAQMAAAKDAGMLGPDGKPLLGPDGKPLAWSSSNWAGRQQGSGGYDDAPQSPGGRNFSTNGKFQLDPKLFGIEESDPDYQSYLTGAKLPPGFMERMEEMFGAESIPNNLRQTDYGRYGRQAEKPAFQPSWAKKKLRSTEEGSMIRKGQYNDSPNKHHRRPIPGAADFAKAQAPPTLESEPLAAGEAKSSHKIIKVRRIKVKVEKDDSSEQIVEQPAEKVVEPESELEQQAEDAENAEQEPLVAEPSVEPEPVADLGKETMQVGPDLASEPEMIIEEPQDGDQMKCEAHEEVHEGFVQAEDVEPETEPEVEAEAKEQSAQIPMTVSVPSPQPTHLTTYQETTEVVKEVTPIDLEQSADAEEEQAKEEYHHEDELLSDEEMYEEEIVEDSEGDEAELSDLQAILAAKQAELARLQAQLTD